MIPIDDPVLYDEALSALADAVGHHYLGRVCQMFLACKHYGREIPQVGDPAGLKVGELERLFDALYIKPSRATPDKILILFSNTYRVPSGQTGPGLAYPSNIWRNNLGLQKPYICYGTVADLQNQQFLLQPRTLCPHLVPVVPGTLQGAGCALKPGPRYRNEDHPKMFRKDPGTGEYFVHNPADVDFYRPMILPGNGNRIPLAALIIALYHEGDLAGGRTAVDTPDFLADFDFTAAEASAYFDDDPGIAAHTRLLNISNGLSWTSLGVAAPVPAAPVPLPSNVIPLPAPAQPRRRGRRNPPTVTIGMSSGPPAGGFWWDAQQVVHQTLVNDGWTVVDMSGAGVGYDLRAAKANATKLVEVKSSVGPCSPTLTAREYAEACQARRDYVLAVVEHFDPAQAVTIQWVEDPAALAPTVRHVEEYYLPRSVWRSATKPAP